MNCEYGEKLILHFYGEAGDGLASEVEAHLKGCASCRDALAALAAAEALLSKETPLPSEAVLQAVMRQARAAAHKPLFVWSWAETALAGAMAAAFLLVFAFAPQSASPDLAWNSGLDSGLDSVEYSMDQSRSELTASSGDWDYNYGVLSAEEQALSAEEV
ncbi:MAG TPA: hypothetical protein DCZ92_08560 [Elusimicrobia bacterium]|nr:MAG: hypothetical protein A2016_01960 [Elusimicrobia bacterium GWF2_62_30]HBA60856.1 hypothetical protein [Elusimicrobiota bacterium]